MPEGWTGANAPTQSVDGSGQTQVGIRQTTQQAILNWQSFNVGARTTLTFDQQGNGSWVALNRVNNATAPSQILGNIKADGHVYVINQSGIIFGGNSQVNVGSLIASTADITDSQFRQQRHLQHADRQHLRAELHRSRRQGRGRGRRIDLDAHAIVGDLGRRLSC